MKRSHCILDLLILCLCPAALPAAEPAKKPKLDNAFFAFDNGCGGLSLDDRAKLLKELGYQGVGYTGAKNLPAALKAFDAHGLKIYSIYVGARVGPDGPSFDPNIKQAVDDLKGRQTVIWLTIGGGKPSSSDFDDQAVKVVGEVADLAEQSGLRVALYPHVGFYVARVEDAVRVVEKVDRKNVGATFNLCHFLKLDDQKNIEPVLRRAMPRLFLVSINGADGGQTNQMGWNRLIQTLDRGDFEMFGFLKTLKHLGYDGPIGLQCYGIRGDARENLTRSITAWRKFVARMAAETN